MSKSNQNCFLTREQLKEIFKDKAGDDNKLSPYELWKWVGVKGYDISVIMRDLDKDKDGYISEAEFLDEMMKGPRMEGLGELFEEIDTDKSGKCSYDEIIEKLKKSKQGLKTLEKFDGEKLMREFEKLDPDQDGLITKDEFVNYMDGCY